MIPICSWNRQFTNAVKVVGLANNLATYNSVLEHINFDFNHGWDIGISHFCMHVHLCWSHGSATHLYLRFSLIAPWDKSSLKDRFSLDPIHELWWKCVLKTRVIIATVVLKVLDPNFILEKELKVSFSFNNAFLFLRFINLIILLFFFLLFIHIFHVLDDFIFLTNQLVNVIYWYIKN